MTTDPPLRRSVLYMPGANARALAKIATIPADAFILDLEDAVAPDAKDLARDQAAAAAASSASGNEIAIRVNGLDTPWGPDDIVAVAGAAPSAVVVPKVSGPGDLVRVADALDAAGAPEQIALWPMIETPAGVLGAAAIAAFERVAVLVMGTNDLALELRAPLRPGRAALVPHLAAAVLAARAAGRGIVDGVFNDLGDPEGFRAECQQGHDLGFDGKTLIHPSQVEPANEVWSPTEDELAHARRVIAAFEEAAAEGRGVITVDGRMIENLHVESARRTLALAEGAAARAER